MGIFEDWFIGEILSFFAGEVEGTWHDAIEMNRRRKELEDSLRRMLEDEKEGQYYNVLSRTLHNSRVLHDCLAFYMDEMPVVDVKNRIDKTLERERLSISEANYVAGFLKKMVDCVRKVMLKAGSAEEQRLVRQINEIKELNTLYALEELMCPSFAQIIISHYEMGVLNDEMIIKQLVRRLHEDDDSRMKLIQAVFHKTGEIIEFPPLIDYEGLRRKGHQAYFDSLFSKDAFGALVDRLAAKFGMEISMGDQRFIEDESIEEKVELQDCYFTLWWLCGGSDSMTLQNVRDYVLNKWESLQYWLVCRAVERRRKSIQFDSEQRLWIEEQCLFQFKKLNVDEPSKMDVLTVETLESMNIEIPEELYSKMLLVPLWMWNGNDAAKYPDYVQNMMPQSVMKELVLYNIRNIPLRDSIAAAHIRYCEQNSISGIKDFVVEYLLREDSRHYWHVALNYLNKLYGIEVIVHEVLPECKENELLQSIANLVPFGFESSMLDAKLYEAYRQTGDSYCQGMLIRRNNRSALEQYYREAEEKNQIPDYPRSNNVPTLTETIRNVSDIALLDIIIDLLRLTCRSGFGDEAHFGLRNSCWSALRNMATVHYDEVLERLKEERKSEDQMYRLTCVDIITSITGEDLVCTDVGMAFESALALTAG